jgi:hypothetical protein
MPKRSTEFQKLVFLVKKHSAGGSKVTESKFLADSKGKEREVDVCIESKVDGIPVTISIECNEKKRRATVKWVEEMKGMHDDLPTDVLILYSRSGFTKGAKEKAETYRKRIVALETLDETFAERLFGGASSLWFKTSALTPTKVLIGVAASGALPAEEVNATHDYLIFNQAGEPITIAAQLVEYVLRLPKARCELLRIGEDHHKNFYIHCGSITAGPGNNPIYLRKDDHDPPLLRLIESLTISGDIQLRTFPFTLKHGRLEDTTVAWGTVAYEGKQALMVASQDKTGETQASFALGDVSIQLRKPPEREVV